jgi:hypothetical protein
MKGINCVTKLTDVTVFGKGIYLPGGTGNPLAKAPERKEGDIKGWSAASRRRMREWIMTHQAPDGWKSWAVDLTFPPLPVGHGEVTVKQSDALRIFGAFVDRCNRITVGAVWRLEIQPRKDCERIDVRGIPQPHYHLIAISPPSLSESTFSEMWLGVLGERGEVKGAKKYACKVSSCEDWQSARVRYLIDHASKSKAAQIAVGWGRHWGVFGRGLYEADKGRVVLLDGRQEVWLRRLMRRGLRRRVVDHRAAGGIPWSCGVELKPFPLGVQCEYMGGSVMLKGWDGVGLPPVADRRRLARVLGVARSNVWALKLARGRVQRGFRFCNGEAYQIAAVRIVEEIRGCF